MEGRFAIDHSKLSLLRVINNPDKRGAAGMNGIVHLCQYVDQKVVVKYFPRNDDSDDDDYEDEDATFEKDLEFWEELIVSCDLLHPNICPVIGTTRDPGSGMRGIVMPFMENGNLKSYYYKNGGRNWDLLKKIQVGLEIASGLAWLDGKKISVSHLDMKPENVLVDQQGVCKLCDFGLSSMKAEKEYVIESNGGNPLYSAPEFLVPSLLPRSSKADVFSFGVLFWEIMIGKTPYYWIVQTKEALIEFLVNQQRRPPLEGIPTAIRKLLVACWHHHPDNRPTPAQLVLMLEKVKLKLTIEDKNARKFWKKHWPEHSTVALPTFLGELLKEGTEDAKENLVRVTRIILFPDSAESTENLSVTLPLYNKFTLWFPTEGGPETFVQEINRLISELTSKDWFFGPVTFSYAEEMVKSQTGLFLVRFNFGERSPISQNPYTVTLKTYDAVLVNWRVSRTETKELRCHDVVAPDLVTLMKRLLEKEAIMVASAKGNPFKRTAYA